MLKINGFFSCSVLKTFIYDPLVEWSKPARGRNNPTESGEIRNEKVKGYPFTIYDVHTKGGCQAQVDTCWQGEREV